MKKSNYTWQLQPKMEIPQAFTHHLQQAKLSPLLSQLLWQRNIHDELALKKFLQPSRANLYDPFLMHDMQRAVERIHKAVQEEEKILIYGDYDADGITSTTVMKEGIELIGGEVAFFLPNRFVHGYGPNLEAFKEQIAAGVQLIITVDNGVAGHAAVAYAMAQGVDVIITDHHELPAELPAAYAIVHPKHPEGSYPFAELAGVGVAFKVVTALLDEAPVEMLDLVAIGTIADLVSLTDENRTLVKLGLQVLQTSDRIGLDSLIQVAGLTKTNLTEETIGFGIAPRLNALGRLGEAAPGVELLTTFDEASAQTIADYIEEQNNQRKEIVAATTKQALAMIDPDASIHVLAQPDWHEGVLGIVAGRIMQETGKPTIILSIDEAQQTAKGSGRSVAALNIYDALNEVRNLFTHFGGHHMAAGMTLPVAKLTALKEHLNRYVIDHAIDLTKGQILTIDEVLNVADVSIPFIQQLQVLAPFGTDNPLPTFAFEAAEIMQVRQIGANNAHLKFQLKQASAQLDAIAFQKGALAEEITQGNPRVAGQLSINEWNGHQKPQLMVADIEISGKQVFDLRGKKGRFKTLPIQQTLYVVFQEASKKLISEDQAFLVTWHDEQALMEQVRKQQFQQVVFVDCPLETDTVKQIVELLQLERVYLMFQSEEEAYLTGMGTREQFATLYKFILKQPQIDVRHQLKALAQHLNLPEKLLIFMIQVFFDLGFVTIENGILKKVVAPQNRPLTESTIYQNRLKKIKTEEFLLYSDVTTIQQWLWHKEEE
ncbi:single-stranded-DNA-specific exonuclease RecJ [Enterococcus faecalis]